MHVLAPWRWTQLRTTSKHCRCASLLGGLWHANIMQLSSAQSNIFCTPGWAGKAQGHMHVRAVEPLIRASAEPGGMIRQPQHVCWSTKGVSACMYVVAITGDQAQAAERGAKARPAAQARPGHWARGATGREARARCAAALLLGVYDRRKALDLPPCKQVKLTYRLITRSGPASKQQKCLPHPSSTRRRR